MSTLTATIIQTDLKWEDKAANLAMLQQKIEAITERTQLVILPEMFSTGFSMKPELLAETMDGPTVGWMRSVAARKRIILTGSIIIKDNENYYNRLIWMLPDGQYGYYDKRHRFAFAKEDAHYSAGSRRLIAAVNGWKIHLQVCYDLRFPVWARQRNAPAPTVQLSAGEAGKTPEYDLLINVANWPQRRSLAWKTLLQARAIENQCYVIGVNRVGTDGNAIYHSGDSMIVDPLGEILYHKADEEAIYTITLKKDDLEDVRTRFPFWKDADGFTLS